jgi:hypothetical protein
MFAVGYVMGARAGRERHAQLVGGMATASQRLEEFSSRRPAARRERGPAKPTDMYSSIRTHEDFADFSATSGGYVLRGRASRASPVEQKKGVAVQDDQSRRIPNAGQESDRHFELPVVREMRPDSPLLPDDSESADRSPSSSAETETLWSKPDGPSGESTVAELGDTFERRWEQVQTRFLGQAARGSRPQKRASDRCVQPASQEA